MKLYKYKKVLWEIQSDMNGYEYAEGPYCPIENCRSQLNLTINRKRVINDSNTATATCSECGKVFDFDFNPQELGIRATEKYQASKRLGYEVISLDIPPTRVGMEAEDKNYWVNIRLGQSQGKKVALIYLGEKNKKQTQKDKVQYFIDLDDEQMRHDASNMPPGALISGIKVRFKESLHDTKFTDEHK